MRAGLAGGCALALVLALLPAPAQAAGIERFQAWLGATRAARADFEQEVFDRQKKKVQASRGSFVFERPGRFRWTTTAPARVVIVGDGDRVWIHDEELEQVTVRRMAKALGSTPAALLAGHADVSQAFELSEAGLRDGLEWVEARPRERDAGFERMRLGLSATGLQAMELLDHFGQTTRLRFSNLQRNPPLEAGTFRFTPPPGVDVLREQ
ncbi:MAG TPA: outer membrane lipoprotein chaperone LolA [Burkholderiales bacterium]